MTAVDERFLLPGEYAMSNRPARWTTLLGSCVSVCLHNSHSGLAAMNHFLLPTAVAGADKGRYGDTAIEVLLRSLFARDPDPQHYTARIFGGAHVIGDGAGTSGVGENNIRVARQKLQAGGITVVQEDVGGNRARRIQFETTGGTVKSTFVAQNRPAPTQAIRVLIVDDSPLVRRVLRKAFEHDGSVEVVGEASNPFEARDLIVSTDPDVITLDIEMPRMNGLEFLQKLRRVMAKPVLIVSAVAKPGSPIEAQALQAGATGVIDKAILQLYRGIDAVCDQLIPKIRAAAGPAHRRAG